MSVAQSQVANPAISTSRARAYVALAKPRIIELLLVTTIPPMIVAARGMPSFSLMFFTVLGGTLAAAGANATNMILDRDIDQIMKRTRRRPLVTGALTTKEAIGFVVVSLTASFVLMTTQVNLLSAALALAAAAFYVVVYTIWLKRSSPSNIVIGGAAGAVPALIGWTAVTGSLAWAPFVLFVLIFLWTPPHFWALAIKYKDDYAAAKVPMLPVVASMKVTTWRIFLYSLAVFVTSLIFYESAQMGLLYLVTAVVAGVSFSAFAWQLHRQPSVRAAMRVFHYSITYLTLLFAAMALDQLLTLGGGR